MLFLVALVVAILWVPSPWDVVLLVVAAVLEVLEVSAWWYWSKRRRPAVGVETMVGRPAVVAAACRPLGQVRIQGELWQARCPEGADPGETVRVQAVDGLVLQVGRTT